MTMNLLTKKPLIVYLWECKNYWWNGGRGFKNNLQVFSFQDRKKSMVFNKHAQPNDKLMLFSKEETLFLRVRFFIFTISTSFLAFCFFSAWFGK